MFSSLSERHSYYENASDIKLLPQLPVILYCEGKNFKRLCRKIEQPYSNEFNSIMAMAMFDVIKEIPEAIFGYQYSDKVFLLLKNNFRNSAPWLNNSLQEIVSTTSSLVTRGFYKSLSTSNTELDLSGDAIFKTKAFVLPKLSEIINYFIWKQNITYKDAINRIAQVFLKQKFKKSVVLSMLQNKNTTEKFQLISKYFPNFIQSFPAEFYNGTGIYKIPILLSEGSDVVQKNKWHFNKNLPIFKEDKLLLSNIVKNGHDIFRADDL